MLDDLISYCLEEIALDGEKGTDLLRLWSFIEEFFKSKEISTTNSRGVTVEENSPFETPGRHSIPTFDDAFKAYFWHQFASNSELLFGRLVQAESEPSVRVNQTNKKAMDMKNAPHFERIDIDGMTLQQVTLKHGSTLVMVATPERQKDALFGPNDPTRQLTPQVYQILQYIARRRAQGATQAELAKTLCIDPRSIFHYIRTLFDLKLIVKMPVVTKGTYTNLCLLARCAPRNQAYAGKTVYLSKESPIDLDSQENFDKDVESIEGSSGGVSFNSDLIRFRMTEILSRAKNQIMLTTDLMKALGMNNPTQKQRRWFNRTIGTLHQQGYMEKVNVPNKDTKKVDRCVKLVKLFDKGKDKEGVIKKAVTLDQYHENLGSLTDVQRQPSRRNGQNQIQSGVLADLPLEYQAYRLIQLSGKRGIIPATLHRSLSNINNRILYKILNRLIKPNQDSIMYLNVKRIAEFQGRERHYRYFAAEAFKDFQKEQGLTEENASQPQIEQNQLSEIIEKKDPLYKEIRLLEEGQDNKDEDFLVPKPSKKKKAAKLRKFAQMKTGSSHESIINSNSVELHASASSSHPTSEEAFSSSGVIEIEPQTLINDDIPQNSKPTLSQEIDLTSTLDTSVDTLGEPVDEFSSIGRGMHGNGIGKNPSTSVSVFSQPSPLVLPHAFTQESSPIRASRARKKSVDHNASINAVRRQKILLQLLEEHRVLECNHLLIKAYQQLEAKQLNKTSLPHSIDKKTLARTGILMEKKGLLKQYRVVLPLLNGGHTTRLLFLHPSLTPSSPQVKEYVVTMQDRTMLIGGTYKYTRIDEADIEVETLEEMKKRVSEETKTDVAFQSLPFSLPNINRVSYEFAEESTVNESQYTTLQLNENEMWWLDTAQDYGWINAKMIRAKLLHQFIITKINSAPPEDKRILKSARIFQTVMLLRDLPLDLYLKLIGQTMVNQSLTEYIQSGEDVSVSVIDLPIEVRTGIFAGNYKFRQNLKRLIDILVALEILKPIARVFDDDGNPLFDSTATFFNEVDGTGTESATQQSVSLSNQLSPAYHLLLHVRMLDYSVPGPSRPLIREYILNTIEDVTIYWNELQYVAQQKFTERLELTQSEDENHNESDERSCEVALSTTFQSKSKTRKRKVPWWQGDESDPLRFINNPRNWLTTYPLTLKQKKSLEAHVDRKKGKTPLDDEAQCRQIAQEIDIPLQRVKLFFKRIQDAFEKKHQTRIDRRNIRNMDKESRRKVAAKSQGIVATGKGLPSFRKRRRGDTMVDKVLRGSRRSERSKKKGSEARNETPEEEILPIIPDEERFESQYESMSQRTRPNWTSREDELVLHAYVILKVRSQKSRFLWAAATKVLPNRTNEMCRRRINVLLKNAVRQDRVNTLLALWERIYQEGIREGAILDNDDTEMVNFDLPSHLNYFMKELASISNIRDPVSVIPLPRDIKKLHSLFKVTVTSKNREKDLFFEDQITGISLRAKMKVLYSHSFTCRLAYDYSVDFKYEEEEIKTEIELIEALVKMILMTPEDQYDPSHAFAILNSYPNEVVSEALEKVKQSGAIVKVKGGNDRRVPGRGYHVSDRFLSVMGGNLPGGFFAQAAAYRKHTKGGHNFSPFANSGTMACLLDLLVHDQVSLSALSLPPLINQRIIPNNKSRDYDLERLQFDIIITPKAEQIQNMQTNVCNRTEFRQVGEDQICNDDIVQIDNEKIFAQDTVVQKERFCNKRGYEGDASIVQTSKRAKLHEGTVFLQEKKAQQVLDDVVSNYDETILKVFETISEFGKLGVTLLSLKSVLKKKSINIPDSQLIHYLSVLSETKLILRVGFSVSRFVCSYYGPLWLVKISRTPVYQSSNLQQPHFRESSEFADVMDFNDTAHPGVNYAPPRMWYDINGHLIETVFRGCLEVVIGIILQKPGIYKSNIYRKLRLIMSHCEIDECLEELIKRRAISCRCILQPHKVTLFSKPKQFKDCDFDLIEAEKISCYWVNSGYYLYYEQ